MKALKIFSLSMIAVAVVALALVLFQQGGIIQASDTPTAPTDLSASSTPVEVSLAWDHDLVGFVDGYKIYRKNRTAGIDFVLVATIPRATLFAYADSSVSPGTAYTYRMRAFNQSGDSSNSSKVKVRTKNLSAPDKVRTLQASATTEKVALTWAASPASSYVTAYNVERREQGSRKNPWSMFTATENSFSDSTVVAGTSYIYRVNAENVSGVGEFKKLRVSVPIPLPASPSGITMSLEPRNGSYDAVLSWEVNPNDSITAYVVVRHLTHETNGLTETTIDVPLSELTTSTRENGAAAYTFRDTIGSLDGYTVFYSVSAVNASGTGGAGASRVSQ